MTTMNRMLSNKFSLTALVATLSALSLVAVAPSARAGALRTVTSPLSLLSVVAADADSLFNDGVTAFNGGDYDGAIAKFTDALKARPRFSDASLARGQAYEAKKQWDLAIADFTKAIDSKPKLADAWLERGRAYAGKGDYASAATNFSKALELRPTYTDVYAAQGDAYYNNKQWNESATAYTTYLSKEPKADPSIYFNRAQAYLNAGKFNEAIADLTKYIPVAKDAAPDATELRGDAYLASKQYDKAIADYTAYIAARPNDQTALAYKGRSAAYLLQAPPKYKEAIPDLRKYTGLHPEDTEAQRNLGIAISKTGSAADAIAAYTAVLNKNGGDLKVRSARAALFVETKQYAPAISDYNLIVASEPNNTVALYNLGLAYSLQGDNARAIPYFDKYIQNRPAEVAAGYNARAIAYTKTTPPQWGKAGDDFAQYVALKPADLEALKNEGIAYSNAKNTAKAQAALTAYDAKKPGDPQVNQILADMALNGSNPNDAIMRLDKLVKANPRDANNQFNLGLAYLNSKQYQPAINAFSAAAAIKPDADTYQNIGVAYFQLGVAGNAAAYDKAVTNADLALNLKPGDPAATQLKADAAFSAKKWDIAAAAYRKMLDAKPGDDYATSQYVASYLNKKDFPGVITATTTALAKKDNADYYNYRAIAYLNQKDYNSAIPDLTKYTQMKSADATGFYNLGAAYSGKMDNANAAVNFEKAVAIKSDYYDAAYQGALAYSKQAETDQADANKANPEFDKAITLFDKAAAIKATGQGAADAYYNKALTLEKKSKANDNATDSLKLAVEAWNRWLGLAPTDPDAPKIKEHVGQLQARIARDGE